MVLEQVAAERATPIASMARDLAHNLTDTLIRAAAVLGLDGPDKNELAAVLTDMPRLDLGRLAVDVHPNRLVLRMSRAWATRGVENRLWAQAGFEVTAAFSNHGKLLEAWIRRTFAGLEARFDSYADAYRAQLGRRDDFNHGTATSDFESGSRETDFEPGGNARSAHHADEQRVEVGAIAALPAAGPYGVAAAPALTGLVVAHGGKDVVVDVASLGKCGRVPGGVLLGEIGDDTVKGDEFVWFEIALEIRRSRTVHGHRSRR